MTYTINNIDYKDEDIVEIFNSLMWENKEALLFDDGTVQFREDFSTAEPEIEEHIIRKIALKPENCMESLKEWELLDENDELITDDDDLRDEYIKEVMLNN